MEAAFKNTVIAYEYVLVKCSDVRPDLDVICERGGKGNRAPGNLLYRAFARCLVTLYQGYPSASKSLVQKALLDLLQAKGVRFLESCYTEGGKFFPLPRDKKMRSKMKDDKGKLVGKSKVSEG